MKKKSNVKVIIGLQLSRSYTPKSWCNKLEVKNIKRGKTMGQSKIIVQK